MMKNVFRTHPAPARKSVRNYIEKAFTLIEILVVISILLIVAGIGIGSYGAARQNILLDIESDKFVKILHSMRNESRAMPKCSGIKFKKNAGLKKIEMPYSQARCDKTKQSASDLMRGTGKVHLSKIKIDNSEPEEFTVIFTPPAGSLQFEPNGNLAEFTLSIINNTEKSRAVSIVRDTGKIEKK